MTDSEIKLQNCTLDIEKLQKQLEEALSKKEELKVCVEAEKTTELSSLDEKLKIVESGIDIIKIRYKMAKLKHYLGSMETATHNILLSKISYMNNNRRHAPGCLPPICTIKYF